jgi:hypothetical protein
METNLSIGSVESLGVRVERLIQTRVGSAMKHLKVISLPGELILTGSCATWYAKQLASQVAIETCPGSLVLNDLEVG